MSDDAELSRVLVAAELPLEGAFPAALAETMSNSEVFVLAYRPIPDQTSPEQAKGQFGEEAAAALADIVEAFEQYGRAVETNIVFTSDVDETLANHREQLGADATLYVRPVDRIDRILAVGTESIDYDRFIDCLSAIGRTPLEMLKLLQVGDDERALDQQELLLEGLKSTLADRGVAEQIVATESIVPADQTSEVLDEAADFDMLVVGVRRPTLGDQILGALADRVRSQTNLPVLVVHPPDE